MIKAASSVQGTDPAVARRCLLTPAVHAAAVITMKPLNKLFVAWLYELEASLRENWKSTYNSM